MASDDAARFPGAPPTAPSTSATGAAPRSPAFVAGSAEDLLDRIDVGVVVLDAEGRHRWANAVAEAMLGVPFAEFEGATMAEAPWRCVDIDGEPIDTARLPGSQVGAGRERARARCGIVTGDATVWVEVVARSLRREGEHSGVVVTLHEIGDELRAESAERRLATFNAGLLELTQRALGTALDARFYQLVTDAAVELIPAAQAASLIMRDAAGDYRFRAATNYDMAQLAELRLHERDLSTDPHGREVQLLHGFDNSVLPSKTRSTIEASGPSADIRSSLAVPVMSGGSVVAFFHIDNFERDDAFSDDAVAMARLLGAQVGTLWQRLSLEARLEHLAHRDVLTGLPNRRRLERQIEEELAALRDRGEGTLGVLLLDLDDFKEINDTHGHAFGDRVVRAVAGRLRRATGPDDLLVRWGGDEFLLLTRDPDGNARIEAAAERLLEALSEPISVRGLEIRVRASLGIAVSRGDAERIDASTEVNAEDLMRHADIALYRAKEEFRGGARHFDPRMYAAVETRQQLEREIERGLERDEFVLFYQPRVSLRSGRVVGAEALVRWRHPERGLLGPGAFIPFAEASGLILPLGDRILELAVARAAAWRAAGWREPVAVNLSARQLASAELIDRVRELGAAHRLPGSALEFEVTETTAVRDVAQSSTYLEQLRDLGAGVALDDFGTAYSALGLLSQLPITTLKIDHGFVARMTEDPKVERIVELVIALGRGLDLNVVAEGVETLEQQRRLARFGCHAAQGFRFARPVAEPDLAARYPPIAPGIARDSAS